jgi:hypothetical protein
LGRIANSSRKKAPIFSWSATNWRSKQTRRNDSYSSGPIGDHLAGLSFVTALLKAFKQQDGVGAIICGFNQIFG